MILSVFTDKCGSGAHWPRPCQWLARMLGEPSHLCDKPRPNSQALTHLWIQHGERKNLGSLIDPSNRRSFEKKLKGHTVIPYDTNRYLNQTKLYCHQVRSQLRLALNTRNYDCLMIIMSENNSSYYGLVIISVFCNEDHHTLVITIAFRALRPNQINQFPNPESVYTCKNHFTSPTIIYKSNDHLQIQWSHQRHAVHWGDIRRKVCNRTRWKRCESDNLRENAQQCSSDIHASAWTAHEKPSSCMKTHGQCAGTKSCDYAWKLDGMPSKCVKMHGQSATPIETCRNASTCNGRKHN